MIPDLQPPSRRAKSAFQMPAIPMAAYGAAVLVLVVAIGLWLLSRPSDAGERLAALETKASAIRVASQAPGDLDRFPPGSVCTTKLDESFRNQLTAALSNTGLTVDALDVRAEGRVDGKRPLMAYAVSLKGTGSYEQTMTGLDLLARNRPRLFVENLTLRNQTDKVALNLEGRLYCRWMQQG